MLIPAKVMDKLKGNPPSKIYPLIDELLLRRKFHDLLEHYRRHNEIAAPTPATFLLRNVIRDIAKILGEDE